MKHLSSLLIILFIGSIFTSCGDMGGYDTDENLSIEDDFDTITINNEYSILVANYMKVADELNDEASLQYQAIFKEAYMIIIDEPTDEVMETFKELGEWDDELSVTVNYRSIQLQYLAESIDINTQSEPVSIEVSDYAAEWVEIEGTVEGIEEGISYFFTFLEAGDKVYMLMFWTLSDRSAKFRKTFEKSAKSFRVLNQ